MIYVNLDYGEDPETGRQNRKQLIASRRGDGTLELRWQDLEPLWEAHRGATGD